jgi:hypothetical protein
MRNIVTVTEDPRAEIQRGRQLAVAGRHADAADIFIFLARHCEAAPLIAERRAADNFEALAGVSVRQASQVGSTT